MIYIVSMKRKSNLSYRECDSMDKNLTHFSFHLRHQVKSLVCEQVQSHFSVNFDLYKI